MDIRKIAVAAALVAGLVVTVGILASTTGTGVVTAGPARDAAGTVSVQAGGEDDQAGEHEGEHEDAGEAGENEGTVLAGQASVSEADARAAATAKVGGTVVGVELEREGGLVLYSIELDNGSEVEVDANTGEVIAVEAAND